MNQVDAPSALDFSSLRLQAQAIKHSWKAGAQLPDTRAVLDAHPELAADHSVVVELAFEEYCLRRRAGEVVDVESFCARFPEQRARLRSTIDVHGEIGTLSSFFEGLPDQPAAAPLVQMLRLQPLGPGVQLDDFTLVRQLGRGGFARVFLATEASTGDRPVVLKLSTDGSEEARTLGRLAHPNIVPILSTRRVEARSLTVVCMPFLGSSTLEDVLRHLYRGPERALPERGADLLTAARTTIQANDPLPPAGTVDPCLREGSFVEGVLHLGLCLAETLVFLHARPFYHRDLKPSNILLTPDGRPLLLDFNLSEDGIAPRAWMGGTIAYMAPEQIECCLRLAADPEAARPPLDGRADLFSLAVILYQLLTGKHPFDPFPADLAHPELGALVLERQRGFQSDLHRLNPQVPPQMAQLIERCLAFDPADRPRDAAELVAGLKQFFRPVPRLGRWLGRHPRLRTALATLALLAAGATGWTIATQPSAVQALMQQGDAALRAEDPVAARDSYVRATKHDNRDPRLWFRLGQAHLATRNVDAALDAFARADELRPDHGPTLASLAYCRSRRGEQGQAIALGERAVQHGMATAAVYNNLAFACLQKNRVNPAWKWVEEALQLNPNLGAARYNRALIVQRLQPAGWRKQVEDHINAAIKLCPPHQDLEYDAGRLKLAAWGRDLPPRKQKLSAKQQAELIAHFGRAIDLGKPVDNIRNLERLLVPIKNHPDYSSLLNRRPGSASRENPRLVPPCPDQLGD